MDFPSSQLARFFILSLALHLVFLFSWPNTVKKTRTVEQIPFTFLPAPKEKKEPVRKVRKTKPRPVKEPKEPAQLAKKTTPHTKEAGMKNTTEEVAKPQIENPTIVRRPLPSLKQLMSKRTKYEGKAINLHTRDPKYVTYNTTIKRAIERTWKYPELAKRNGLEGKLILEFTVLADGILEGSRITRSSGISVLDQEALRAVKAAAPFRPIPPWIGGSRLRLTASFEYDDDREHDIRIK
ncbi:MAG: energy transducer TonB [Candidatus Binatia bacterium]